VRGLARPAVWLGLAGTAVLVAVTVWVILSDHWMYRYFVRLYEDREFLRTFVERLGFLGPLVFIALQALQVVIAPIPGEATGVLGGFLFGRWLGFIYSTIGLTVGSLLAFAVGRALGTSFVRRVVDERTWARMGFIIEAEGAILCFIIFLIPGLPKDIVCYLFGLSPMPFWLFAITSTIGRMPGTWVLSSQGSTIATGHYVELALVTAITAMVALPLFYYRHRITSWSRRPPGGPGDRS
jgi:uncharacterized membrane protein YdjX (TVP38/TMEM64 family)